MPPTAIAFDVYGTLVDPLAMREPLRALAGAKADHLAELWREKQVEYAFRRALMRRYEPFSVCTEEALRHAAATVGVPLSDADRLALLDRYAHLPAFPDAAPALEALRARGFPLVAFSNGREAEVRALLGHAGLGGHLDRVISVDDLRTFKPDPAVYLHLAKQLGRAVGEVWLVSANGWDVLGAWGVGLRAAWLRRRPDIYLDPWDVQPDLTLASLGELAEALDTEGNVRAPGA